ncbi:MAG: hypothetical protein K0S27_955 [Gammaproteobacteria bacterium]|jgi:hypothetical protein|nr:hypothetical protein [Gammaproteobacteria bacterium]
MFLRGEAPENAIPHSLTAFILNYSNLETASRTMRVNKKWHDFMLSNNRFWETKYKRHFPFYYGKLQKPQLINWYQKFLADFKIESQQLYVNPLLLSLVKERDFERLKENTEEITKILRNECHQLKKAQPFYRKKSSSFLFWAQLNNDQEMLDYFYKCTKPFDKGIPGWWEIICRQDVGKILRLSPASAPYCRSLNIFEEATYHGHLRLLEALYQDPSREAPDPDSLITWAAWSASSSIFKYVINKIPIEERKNVQLEQLIDILRDPIINRGSGIDILNDLLTDLPAKDACPELDRVLKKAIVKSVNEGYLPLLQVLFQFNPGLFPCGERNRANSSLPFFLFEEADEDIQFSLCEATRKGYALVVEWLLECGYNVDGPSRAISSNKEILPSSPSEEKTEDVYSASTPLLSPSEKTEDSCSIYPPPLFSAAYKKNYSMMQILLQWKASRKIAFHYALDKNEIQAAIILLQTFIDYSEPSENKKMARALILGYAENLQKNLRPSLGRSKFQLFKGLQVKQAALELKKLFLDEDDEKSEESKVDVSTLTPYRIELTKEELGDIYRIARQFFPEKGLPDFKSTPVVEQALLICCNML